MTYWNYQPCLKEEILGILDEMKELDTKGTRVEILFFNVWWDFKFHCFQLKSLVGIFKMLFFPSVGCKLSVFSNGDEV